MLSMQTKEDKQRFVEIVYENQVLNVEQAKKDFTKLKISDSLSHSFSTIDPIYKSVVDYCTALKLDTKALICYVILTRCSGIDFIYLNGTIKTEKDLGEKVFKILANYPSGQYAIEFEEMKDKFIQNIKIIESLIEPIFNSKF